MEYTKEVLEIGGATVDELEDKLKTAQIKVHPVVKGMIQSAEFFVETERKKNMLAVVPASSLPKATGMTTEMFLEHVAEKMNLKLCPPEVAIWYRLQHLDQPALGRMGYELIASPELTDGYGLSNYFTIESHDNGLALGDYGNIGAGNLYHPQSIVFLIPEK